MLSKFLLANYLFVIHAIRNNDIVNGLQILVENVLITVFKISPTPRNNVRVSTVTSSK